jgi:hypothetical protein
MGGVMFLAGFCAGVVVAVACLALLLWRVPQPAGGDFPRWHFIKPCPQCMDVAAVVIEDKGGRRRFWIECRGCHYSGPLEDTVDAAVTQWNMVNVVE